MDIKKIFNLILDIARKLVYIFIPCTYLLAYGGVFNMILHSFNLEALISFLILTVHFARSEERRVGKECRL